MLLRGIQALSGALAGFLFSVVFLFADDEWIAGWASLLLFAFALLGVAFMIESYLSSHS